MRSTGMTIIPENLRPDASQRRHLASSLTLPSAFPDRPRSCRIMAQLLPRCSTARARQRAALDDLASWMQERDPNFVAKAVEIIGLGLEPPTDGPTFCFYQRRKDTLTKDTAANHRLPAAGSPAAA